MFRKNSILSLLFLTVAFGIWGLSCCPEKIVDPPYVVMYAFDAEGAVLVEKMAVDSTRTILGREAHYGNLAGKKIVLVESGMGMINATIMTQALIEKLHPKGIVFSGIAGAVDDTVEIGDIVICGRWKVHDYGYIGPTGFQPENQIAYQASSDSMRQMSEFSVDSSYFLMATKLADSSFAFKSIGSRFPKLIIGGNGVSGNTFIDNREKRLWLKDKFDALITDMESASVAQACVASDVPYLIFRSASDLAGGSGDETAVTQLNQFFKVAADNSAEIVVKFLGMIE
jgi:adenosylhomocysteine nucleosidase